MDYNAGDEWRGCQILPHHFILIILFAGCCGGVGRSCDLEKWLLSIFLTNSPSQTEMTADRDCWAGRAVKVWRGRGSQTQ